MRNNFHYLSVNPDTGFTFGCQSSPKSNSTDRTILDEDTWGFVSRLVLYLILGPKRLRPSSSGCRHTRRAKEETWDRHLGKE